MACSLPLVSTLLCHVLRTHNPAKILIPLLMYSLSAKKWHGKEYMQHRVEFSFVLLAVVTL